MKRGGLLVVALALLAAPMAHASQFRWLRFPTKAPTTLNLRQGDWLILRLATAAAVDYWGKPPCAVTWRRSSTVPSAVGTGGVHVDRVWAWTSGCTVTLNRRIVTPEFQIGDFPSFCALVVHEYGHLFGHWDSSADPATSITYPVISDRNKRVPACVRRYRQADAIVATWLSTAPA